MSMGHIHNQSIKIDREHILFGNNINLGANKATKNIKVQGEVQGKASMQV